MAKFLTLFLLLFSLSKVSNAQTNCRSECVVSGKSHICQWETICDPIAPDPILDPTPAPTPEPTPQPSEPPKTISAPNILNPANPLSILNPNSPLKPPSVQIPQTNMDGNAALIQENSAPQPTAQTNAEETSEKKTFLLGFGLGLSLELIGKPSIVQPNLFPVININQPMPIDYQNAGQLFIDIYGVSLPNQTSKFNNLKQDAVELEQ
jgi:hypothetical protein